MDVTRETTRRLEASCRLMLYAYAVRRVWLVRKEERKREGRDGSDYVIGLLRITHSSRSQIVLF